MVNAEARPLLTQSLIGGHGGTKPVPRARGPGGKPVEQRSDVDVLLYVLPVAMFMLCSVLVGFLVYSHAALVWGVVGICAAISLVILVTGSYEDNFHLLYLGVLCVIAVATAGLGGYANYSLHTMPYYKYLDSREYYNTLPSEPAAAHEDAGRITFAAGTMVDRTKAVGYNQVSIYCVAPIVDSFSLPMVEYWAVGMDCCAQRSDFACDDSLVPGVRGGTVQIDSGFLTGGEVKYYKRAVQVAEAAYDIQSASEPIFIRWYADPMARNDALWRTATYVFLGLAGVHALLNVFMAFGMVIHANAHDQHQKEAGKQERQQGAMSGRRASLQADH